jgi:hypothetical protein
MNPDLPRVLAGFRARSFSLWLAGVTAASFAGACTSGGPPAAARDAAAADAAAKASADGGAAAAAADGGAAPAAGDGGAKTAAADGGGGAAEAACKVHAGGRCCLPEVTAHLPKELVFAACKGAEAAYLGERKTSDGCRYVFGKEGVKTEDTTLEMTVSKLKNVPESPTDPFFKWKKAGKAYYTDKAASPKSAPMLARGTGLFYPGQGEVVSVTVPTAICPAVQARKLAVKLK